MYDNTNSIDYGVCATREGWIQDLLGGGVGGADHEKHAGSGSEPPVVSRGRALVEGETGPEAESFSSIFTQRRGQKLSI